MPAAQVIIKRGLGQLVLPVGFAGHCGVNLRRRNGRGGQVEGGQAVLQRGLHILPQAGQVIELVTAAGIREGKGVKIIARKKFPQGRGIYRTVELIKSVICQGIAIPYQGGFLCKFGIFPA